MTEVGHRFTLETAARRLDAALYQYLHVTNASEQDDWFSVLDAWVELRKDLGTESGDEYRGTSRG